MSKASAPAPNIFTEQDLRGNALRDVACHQCGGTLCNSKVGAIYEGRAMLFCSRKPACQEVLSHRGRNKA